MYLVTYTNGKTEDFHTYEGMETAILDQNNEVMNNVAEVSNEFGKLSLQEIERAAAREQEYWNGFCPDWWRIS